MAVQCCGCAVLWLCSAVVVKCCGRAGLGLCSAVVVQYCGCAVLWPCRAGVVQCCGCAVLGLCRAVALQGWGCAVLWLCSSRVVQCCMVSNVKVIQDDNHATLAVAVAFACMQCVFSQTLMYMCVAVGNSPTSILTHTHSMGLANAKTFLNLYNTAIP